MANRDSKGRFIKGHIPLDKNKGRKLSKEHKEKLSLAKIGKYFGDKSPNWKGGISKIEKLCRRMIEYKLWRSTCFQRDNWTCQICKNRGYITVHHIKGFKKIIKENNIKTIKDARTCEELWNLCNGITLCENCHKNTDNYRGRGINE